MSSNKHTAGNWSYTNSNNSDYFDIDCDGNRIASILINPENPDEAKKEAEANAKLIAAAPKLLEACERALSWFYLNLKKDSKEPGCLSELIEAIKEATGN